MNGVRNNSENPALLRGAEPDGYSRTSWHGVSLAHPADWELTSATVARGPCRLVFADRRCERMTVRWQTMKYVPNLARALEQREKADGKTRELRDLPPGWRGVLATGENGATVHAGRFFDGVRVLLEVILAWRDAWEPETANRIFSLADVDAGKGATMAWEAMGIRADIPRGYRMVRFCSEVGLVEWTFRAEGDKGGDLSLARLGVPNYWLKAPLAKWMESQLEKGRMVSDTRAIVRNGHPGAEVVSRAAVKGWERLTGRQNVQCDAAWLCPVENRVYHLRYGEVRAGGRPVPPAALHVECCQEPFSQSATMHTPCAVSEAIPPGSADILAAVPKVNLAARIARGNNGEVLATVPLRRPRFLVPPLSWILPYSDSRRVRLDTLGAAILDLCDGKRSLEGIMERFAAENKLTFREAQVPVVQFIRMLTERGVVAVAGAGMKQATHERV